MHLNSLLLREFRTYQEAQIEFAQRVTFLIGANASGKTNILEAITLLSMGKSFRGSAENDLIRHGANSFFLRGIYSYDNSEDINQIDYGCELIPLRKKIKYNNKLLSGRSSLIGLLPTVTFSPGDLAISDGGQVYRRKFIDSVLSLYSSDYLSVLMLYNRTLKQRNALLKSIRERKARYADLDPWDYNLIEYGNSIRKDRSFFIEIYANIFRNSLERISKQKDDIVIKITYDENETAFSEALFARRDRDIISGNTSIGPHRDQLLFLNGDSDITRFGSQGQRRSLVLALKMAQFHYLLQTKGERPLLLIDDVLRELDSVRRSAFVELLHQSGQAIFTTPDLEGLEPYLYELRSEIEVKRVDFGRVSSVDWLKDG